MIERAENNYFAAWRLLAGFAEGGVVDEDDDVLYTGVPAPVAYFNAAFVKPPAVPSDCVDRVRAYFDARRVPFTIRFREQDWDGDGLTVGNASPLMVASVDDIAPPPGEIDIRIVDQPTRAAHVGTIAEGFGMTASLLDGFFTPALLDHGAYVGFLAYEGDTPVSTSALIVSDEVAGVYNVATPPEFRGRGLGTAVTAAAVAEGARRGCDITTLQASAMGYPIYEQMGYRTVVRWLSYVGGD